MGNKEGESFGELREWSLPAAVGIIFPPKKGWSISPPSFAQIYLKRKSGVKKGAIKDLHGHFFISRPINIFIRRARENILAEREMEGMAIKDLIA